ncbi:MAG: CDP-glucose 4,6-dehydratase [Terrimicrobiaceae bacterium]
MTGATGFKGAWLCEWLLLLGAEVTGFSLPEPVSTPCLFDQLGLSNRIHDIRGDIRDVAGLRDAMLAASPDFVFHLAAQPLVRRSYREPVETWQTNVLGTIHLLEALRAAAQRRVDGSLLPVASSTQSINNQEQSTNNQQPTTTPLAAVLATTDKCYENREWFHGYREEDALGGYDPYSSSKAACEIAIDSWRRSFLTQNPAEFARPLRVASARAGNVIGGGDWAEDRIVPDIIRALRKGQPIPVRNKTATRPWQHVLEPLSGYLLLASHLVNPSEALASTIQTARQSAASFNFGPNLDSNHTVATLVQKALSHWPGEWEDCSDPHAPHEAGKLNLATDKAFHLLGWRPRWDFPTTIEKTIEWYQYIERGADAASLTLSQIQKYSEYDL